MTHCTRWFLPLSWLLWTLLLLASPAWAACPAGYPLTTPNSDFTSAGNGMVQHTPTGLIWKRCAEGQSWDGTTCAGTAATYTWQQAFERVDAVNAAAAGTENLGQPDWRVPNINELKSLVEQGCTGPAINLTQFPNTPASYFWSASPDAGHSGGAWGVYFSYGFDDWYFRSDARRVRLVRAGQSFLGFDATKPTTTLSDSDGDGLPDEWESKQAIGPFNYADESDRIRLYGFNSSGGLVANDVKFNVPAGNPNKKDIYVWVDQLLLLDINRIKAWINNEHDPLSMQDYQAVIDAFKKHGIDIHFRVNLILPDVAKAWGLSETSTVYISQMMDANRASLDNALPLYKDRQLGFNNTTPSGIRNHLYHYVVAARYFLFDNTTTIYSGGLSNGVGNGIVLAHGQIARSSRANLMHELGHALGLGHGGPWFEKGNSKYLVDSDRNYKPNRFGIMSYIYLDQVPGLTEDIGFDYASFHVANIDESAPKSSLFINPDDTENTIRYYSGIPQELRSEITKQSGNIKVYAPCGYSWGGSVFGWQGDVEKKIEKNISDYNPSFQYDSCPNLADPSGGSKRNINADSASKEGADGKEGAHSKAVYSVLESRTDWDNLVYTFGKIGSGYSDSIPGISKPDYSEFYNTHIDDPHPPAELLYIQPDYAVRLIAANVIVKLVPNTGTSHPFILVNKGKLTDTYDLTATGSNGLVATLQTPGSVTVQPGSSAIISVQSNTAGLAPDTLGLLILKATGRGARNVAGADTTLQIISNAADATPVDTSWLSATTKPGPFSFSAQTSAPLATLVTSNPITVSQITVPVPISIDTGEYQLDNGPWTRLPSFVAPGQRVTVRLTTPPVGNATLTANLNINGVTGGFSVTTSAVSGTTWTGTTPSGGNATLTLSGPGVGTSCKLASANFITAPAPGQPANVQFPYGLIDFRLTGCAGSTVNVTMSYPAALPAGTQYWKQNGATYTLYPATINGNQITFAVTDNGAGDSDPTAGAIHDPSGPGIPNGAGGVADIPTLSEWVMLILLSLLLGLGSWTLRRRAMF